mmetsp:Transcript_25301/g.63430  ORF Transcript_25301/g.63430 Transcript_25301/m.63430 type:complete len:210 (+) Transcript_25301:676-1305(+)
MLYPQNGFMANGSARSTPRAPAAAAVVSELTTDPMNTPWFQSNAWYTSGTVEERRPPNMMASMGTPSGLSHCGSITGHWRAGTVNLELGWAASTASPLNHSRRSHDVSRSGGGDMPSHHTSLSSVMATLVKSVLRLMVCMQLGLVFMDVPGATPKKPFSGLMARRVPSLALKRIQAMSSPTVSTFQPGSVGCSMARLVLPQALGKAAAT